MLVFVGSTTRDTGPERKPLKGPMSRNFHGKLEPSKPCKRDDHKLLIPI